MPKYEVTVVKTMSWERTILVDAPNDMEAGDRAEELLEDFDWNEAELIVDDIEAQDVMEAY